MDDSSIKDYEELLKQIKEYKQEQENLHICPHCGRCPTCGRPYVAQWKQPYWPQPYWYYAPTAPYVEWKVTSGG